MIFNQKMAWFDAYYLGLYVAVMQMHLHVDLSVFHQAQYFLNLSRISFISLALFWPGFIPLYCNLSLGYLSVELSSL